VLPDAEGLRCEETLFTPTRREQVLLDAEGLSSLRSQRSQAACSVPAAVRWAAASRAARGRRVLARTLARVVSGSGGTAQKAGGAGRGWPEVALALVYAEEDACGALSSEDEGEDGSEVEEGSEEDGE